MGCGLGCGLGGLRLGMRLGAWGLVRLGMRLGMRNQRNLLRCLDWRQNDSQQRKCAWVVHTACGRGGVPVLEREEHEAEMSEELKKCPFCGSNELYDDSVPSVYGEYTWIRCEKCAAQGSAFLDDEPSKHWNTRPIEDALRKDIMELQQERYAKEIETRATIDALRKQLEEAYQQQAIIRKQLEIAVEAIKTLDWLICEADPMHIDKER